MTLLKITSQDIAESEPGNSSLICYLVEGEGKVINTLSRLHWARNYAFS